MKQQIFIIGILMGLALLVIGCGNGIIGNSVNEEYVKIPLSDLSDKVQFYSYDGKINYFAVLGSDGKPRTAFDACDVCGGYEGYEQVGNDIKCKKCGRVFSIDGLGTKNKGYGCWPSHLSHEIKDDMLLIKIDDIKQGESRFI
jgi:uncharacterized membrane protein